MLTRIRSFVTAAHIVRAAAAAALLTLAACTGPGPNPDPDPDPDPDPTLTLQPAATNLVVIRGGSKSLALSIARTGDGSANVELSVAGVPGGVTATFTEPSLANEQTSSELLFVAEAGAAESVADIVVTATLSELVVHETVG